MIRLIDRLICAWQGHSPVDTHTSETYVEHEVTACRCCDRWITWTGKSWRTLTRQEIRNQVSVLRGNFTQEVTP